MKSAALQMQQFVGEEKNDLLDYLRSLQPEKVIIIPKQAHFPTESLLLKFSWCFQIAKCFAYKDMPLSDVVVACFISTGWLQGAMPVVV